ncbi:RNA polymerase subunit sigma-24 [Streptomyces diacarni]|uniref:RNA polymerase subunit sigma-24 n=1 Tax=Streptomyces diacarni TaxID=2800381 RepID=A0A367EFK5_9ACTN|nr:sigma-70 family RNA polymerase sigma factor [Streptomyces diacarni]RCG16876.1 RNA polymerase subunit sigma-24 [Streptomyces diacarni]
MTDAAVARFEAHRGRLFGIAYRMLGSATDAEDVLQEAYLRWQRADQEAVAAPGAWLATVVTRLCLNELASARVRREQYVGQWLPEPVLTGAAIVSERGTAVWGGAGAAPLGPLETAEQRDSVSLALLVLLERLTPPERAVFVLREAFGYPHREIAEVLGVSEANSRQLYRRAKRAVHGTTQTVSAAPEGATAQTGSAAPEGSAPPGGSAAPDMPYRSGWSGLVETFVAAAREGDLRRLERLLAEDVVSYADGGGKVNTARRPISGRARVARYLAGGLERFAAGVALVPCEVNGGPALLGLAAGRLLGVLSLDVVEGRITTLRIIANPDKVRYAAQQLASRGETVRKGARSDV